MADNQEYKSAIFYFFHIVLPIVMGFFIYLFLRDTTLMTAWLRKSLLIPKVTIPDTAFSAFVLFYLPDILWAYSLTFTIALVLQSAPARHFGILIASGSIETSVEVLQKIGVIGGTFDFLDILVEVAASIVALRIINRFERRKNEKDS